MYQQDLALGLSEQISIAGVPFPIFKNRVSDEQAASITNNPDLQRSDLVPGVYEVRLKRPLSLQLYICPRDVEHTLTQLSPSSPHIRVNHRAASSYGSAASIYALCCVIRPPSGRTP